MATSAENCVASHGPVLCRVCADGYGRTDAKLCCKSSVKCRVQIFYINIQAYSMGIPISIFYICCSRLCSANRNMCEVPG